MCVCVCVCVGGGGGGGGGGGLIAGKRSNGFFIKFSPKDGPETKNYNQEHFQDIAVNPGVDFYFSLIHAFINIMKKHANGF